MEQKKSVSPITILEILALLYGTFFGISGTVKTLRYTVKYTPCFVFAVVGIAFAVMPAVRIRRRYTAGARGTILLWKRGMMRMDEKIWYLNIEAVPKDTSPEKSEFGGAFVNIWVRAASKDTALLKAREYVDSEEWVFVELKDMHEARCETYLSEPGSLEGYDNACEYGIDAEFYTWPAEELV